MLRDVSRWFGVLVVLASLAAAARALEPSTDPVDILQHDPSFLIHAEVDHVTRMYRDGDSLSLRVVSESDAYVYVLYKQADGQVFQVFPNSVQPENHVQARESIRIPASDDLFRWTVSAPFGKEAIKVVASKRPIKSLSDPELRKELFNAVAGDKIRSAGNELDDEPPSKWAEDLVDITTVGRDEKTAPATQRRFAVFFGSAQFKFDKEYEQAWGHRLQLPAPVNNVRRMSQVMREVGELDDLRVYTNEQVTRRGVEEAITGWLPSVSRPGDTIFIYYSDHGGQMIDDNNEDAGDETDGKDEYLVTHDCVTYAVLQNLLKEQNETRARDPALAQWVDDLAAISRRGRTVAQQESILIRQTGISDDLFGHWLQRLAGRKIVVLLDICHAAGFAAQEKSLDADASIRFDFVDGEMSRLKDLGQPDCALIAACAASEVSWARRVQYEDPPASKDLVTGSKEDLALFTYYLVESMLQAREKLTVAEVEDHCLRGMESYFDNFNAILRKKNEQPLAPHRPILFNDCRTPVYFKP